MSNQLEKKNPNCPHNLGAQYNCPSANGHDNTNHYIKNVNLTISAENSYHDRPQRRQFINKPNKARKTTNTTSKIGKVQLHLHLGTPEETICPSSLAKYFATKDYVIKECSTKFKPHIVCSVKVPVLNLPTIEHHDVTDFLEWLGMVVTEGDLETDDASNYVNSYVSPEPSMETGLVKCLQWRGIFRATQITELIKQLCIFNETVDKPWIAVYVQGFSDAPVSWNHEEHHYFTNGDNGYTIIFNQQGGVCCQQRCSRKKYK